MMKKKTSLVFKAVRLLFLKNLLVMFILLLAGCGSDTETSLPYAYGNMQKNVPSGNFMDAGDSILFFGPDGQGVLYKLDKETLETEFFCTDPTCSHKNSKCMAGGAYGNLEAYNGKIYASTIKGEMLVLKDDRFEPLSDQVMGSFSHGNDKCYVLTNDGALQEYDIKGKFLRTVREEFTGMWCVVCKDQMIYNTLFEIRSVDLYDPSKDRTISEGMGMTDGESIFFIDNLDCRMYRCDLEGNQKVLLSEEPVLTASLNFDEDYLYYRYYYDNDLSGRLSHAIIRQKKDGSEEAEIMAELPVHAYTIYTVPGFDYLIVVGKLNFASYTYDYYLVRKDGSMIKKIELPD